MRSTATDTTANGGDALGIGPTVELVPANGHANGNGNGLAPATVNGNGHHEDEAPEPQQSLFSWAEFMAEPVKPKRNGKPQPASLSMFEWAMEQEREKEPVGLSA